MEDPPFPLSGKAAGLPYILQRSPVVYSPVVPIGGEILWRTSPLFLLYAKTPGLFPFSREALRSLPYSPWDSGLIVQDAVWIPMLRGEIHGA
jgi:hypothetical protein